MQEQRAEIERLRTALKDASEKLRRWGGWDEPSGMLLDDLADDIDAVLNDKRLLNDAPDKG